jgi:hypothetical protein
MDGKAAALLPRSGCGYAFFRHFSPVNLVATAFLQVSKPGV